jgi:nucleotide-binding universal stress UspA family protein
LTLVANQARLKRILVAVDGSQYSSRALGVAVGIAKQANSELIILHVRELPVSLANGDVEVQTQMAEEASRKEAEKMLDDAATAATKEGVKTRKVMKEHLESVVKTIVEFSEKEDVDLIVVGTRGLGGFKRLVLGSVATGLVHYAHCSVLVAR